MHLVSSDKCSKPSACATASTVFSASCLLCTASAPILSTAVYGRLHFNLYGRSRYSLRSHICVVDGRPCSWCCRWTRRMEMGNSATVFTGYAFSRKTQHWEHHLVYDADRMNSKSSSSRKTSPLAGFFILVLLLLQLILRFFHSLCILSHTA